jgi:hypothetical protein
MRHRIIAGIGIVGLLLIGASLFMAHDYSWQSWAVVLAALLAVGGSWTATRDR